VKILPAKIETALQEALFTLRMEVKDLFVSSLPDPVLGQKLIAVLESGPFSAGQEKELKEQLKKELTSYEIPRDIFYMPRFEQTASGKTDKMNTLKKLGQ
jgi:O-succinylbenzoic acid--CoA ligase